MWTSMNVLHSSLIGGSVLPARDENPWAAEVPDCEGQSIVPFGELWSASGLGYGMSAGGAAARLLYTISFHQICLFFLISFAFVAWAWVIVDRGGLVILNRVLLLSGLRLISQLLLCQVQKSRIGHSDSDCGVLQKVDVKPGEHILTRLSNVQYWEKNVNRWGHRNRLYYTLNNRAAPKKERGWFRADGCFQKSNDRLLSPLFPWSNTNLLAAHSEFL